MQSRNNIILILDSVLDDYYFLWECFSEYAQIKNDEANLITSFSEALKEAYMLK